MAHLESGDIDPTLPPGSPRTRRWLGATSILLLSAVLVWPFVRARITGPAPLPGEAVAPVPARSPATASRPAAVSSQAASDPDLLAQQQRVAKAVAAQQRVAKAMAEQQRALKAASEKLKQLAPLPESDDASACIASFVPEGTFGRGRLDWVCEQPNVWSIQLDLYGRAVSRGTGPGVSQWTSLGRFELGAIAILRTACCPKAAPLIAKLPLQKCGSLSDVLTALAQHPSPEHAERYDQVMSCLAERKVWFPEGWSRVTEKQSRQAFDQFLGTVRKRR